VAEQRTAELTQEQVARWARGWPTDRERRAAAFVHHLEALSKAQIAFGREEEEAWQLDGGRALEAARNAAKAAVVAALQPIYDQARAELDAARRERGELVKAHGR
jgi:hypothetical protein